jgi:hypothetical protein
VNNHRPAGISLGRVINISISRERQVDAVEFVRRCRRLYYLRMNHSLSEATSLFTRLTLMEKTMKKIAIALAVAATTFCAVAPAYAAPYHHHRECHKVRVHHHWENRCR